jgi:hypothetical protein
MRREHATARAARERLKVADEVWIAATLRHREHPERIDFAVDEIVERARKEGLTPTLRGSVHVHVTQHCVANRRPKPGRYRMLLETGRGRRRLFRPGDPYDPAREGAKSVPHEEEVPSSYRGLLDWYRTVCTCVSVPSSTRWNSWSPSPGPGGNCGPTSPRTSTCGASARAGSEPRLLGYEPLHLPLRRSRGATRACVVTSTADGRAQR